MKNLQLILMLAASLIMMGCNSDDDKPGQSNNKQLAGTWNLISVNGGFAGKSVELDKGEVTWTFNGTGTSVTVVNNHDASGEVPTLPSGTYDVDFEASEVNIDICLHSVYIDETDHGCLSINGNELILSQSFADGIELKFTKSTIE